MRQAMMILLSALALLSGVAMMEIGERTLTTGVFAILLQVVVWLYRRFSRSPDDVIVCLGAAVIATVQQDAAEMRVQPQA